MAEKTVKLEEPGKQPHGLCEDAAADFDDGTAGNVLDADSGALQHCGQLLCGAGEPRTR